MSCLLMRPPAPVPGTRRDRCRVPWPCGGPAASCGCVRRLGAPAQWLAVAARRAAGFGGGGGAAAAAWRPESWSRCGGLRGAGCGGRRAAAAAAPSPAASMVPTTVWMGTVLPSPTLISFSTPAEGDGISASTLSVEISNSGSSRSTLSPGFFSHLVMVPSKMLSPIWGITMSTAICGLLCKPVQPEAARHGVPCPTKL